jgi:peptide subunit release factor 1 (eRF1)
LQDILDEYARYGVIFVDREGARFFLFHLGQLQEVDGTLGEELKRHKQGGWGAQRLQRRVDGVATQNLKEAAEAARLFCTEHKCSRVILAGTDDNLSAFRGMLPRGMADAVVGEMAMDMAAGEAEIREKTMAIISEHIQAEETSLVERLITAAAKGGAGVIGLVDTLSTLQEDRVHILITSEGYEAEGFRCTNCGYLGAQELDICPYCSSEVRPHEHVIDAAIRMAIEKGVAVKIVADNDQLEQAGKVGAILRY